MMQVDDDDPFGEIDNNSINGEGYGADDGGEDDGGDEFEEALVEAKARDVWATGGPQKNAVVRELIKCFGSMVESHPAEFAMQDQNGRYRVEDMVFEKLLDASKYVTRAKRALLQHENFDTREFTIFICNKHWVKNILRPLLELCAKDDSVMAVRVSSLLLILIRRLSEDSMKVLASAPTIKNRAKRLSVLDLQSAESEAADLREEDMERALLAAALAKPANAAASGDGTSAASSSAAVEATGAATTTTTASATAAGAAGQASIAGVASVTSTAEALKNAALLAAQKAREAEIRERKAMEARLRNVYSQLRALLSFKEALCSEKCNEAICNAFKEYWMREQVNPSEDNKFYVAIAFGYVRRILAIDADASWASAADIKLVRALQDKYIVQLRLLLSVIPGICSDILRPYHTDWLQDIILIIYFSIRGFNAKELFAVWKSDALIRDFNRIDRSITNDSDAMMPTATPQAKKKKDPASKDGCADRHGVVVPADLVRQSQSNVFGEGALSGLLKKERINRTKGPLNGPSTSSSTSSSRGSIPGLKAPCAQAGSRLRGVFHRPLQNLSVAASVAPPAATRPAAAASAVEAPAANTVAAPVNQTSSVGGKIGAENESGAVNAKKHVPQVAKILRDPFSAESALSQQNGKRGKRTLAFLHGGNHDTAVHQVLLSSTEHQQASVVAATLVNLLTNEVSLKPLVRRVNEDLRRDELRIGPELELRYFEMLSVLLHYHRLKVSDAHSAYLTKVNSAVDQQHDPWAPDLINVMDALDRMSFSRVLVSIDRFSKNPARLDDIATPMALYKEMICYLRLQLESGLSGHHELAVARLYTLFYVSQEKGDPLPRLLSLWRPGTYSRRHLETLVELVHETLKTLDAAQSRFQPDDEDDDVIRKRYKSARKRNEMDLEQYVLSAMRFRVDDYFKRLATNQVVRMYTKLLSCYGTNDPTINHYVYCFFQRMCNYTIESDYLYDDFDLKPKTPAQKGAAEAAETDKAGVHVGFMLFNIQTMEVFNTILNDVHAQHNAQLKPLICLIKMLVRQFGELTEKNHMMFVEAMFVHAYPHEFSRLLESVYDAPAYIHERHRQPEEDEAPQEASTNRMEMQESSSDSDDDGSVQNKKDDDYGDEFNENDMTAAFTKAPKSKKRDKSCGKGMKRKRARDSSGESSDSESEGNRTDSDDTQSQQSRSSMSADSLDKAVLSEGERRRPSRAAAITTTTRRMRGRRAASSVQTRRPRHWSSEEDGELRRLYRIYAGTHSVFASIAMNEKLSHRSEAQIQRRVRDLKLHEQLHEEEQDDSPAKAMMGNTKQNQTLQSTNTPDGVSPPTSHANESSGSLFDGNDDEDIFERRSMALVRKAASAAYEVALNYDDSEDERRGTNKKHIHRSINKINKRTRSGGDSDSDGEMELFETETPAAPLRDASVGHRAIVRSVIDDDDE